MPTKFADRRKLQKVGNSAGTTIPASYLQKKGFVDEDGNPREVQFEVEETDDGALKLAPSAE